MTSRTSETVRQARAVARSSVIARPDWREGIGLGLVAVLVCAASSWVPSKWWDETATQTGASRSLTQLWTQMRHVDAVHGVYYALMHSWVRLVGTSELALRFPSAVAAGVACLGVWVLGNRLASRALGRAAAVSFVVLPRVTWFGMEARSLALTAAVAAWSTVLLVDLLSSVGEGRRAPGARIGWLWCGYALLSGFGIALDVYLGLVLAAHAVTALWWLRGRVRPVLWPWLAAAAVAVAMGAPIIRLSVGQSAALPDVAASITRYVRQLAVQQYFMGAQPTLYQILELPPVASWAWAAIGLAALGWTLALLALLRERTSAGGRVRAVALPWIMVPVALVVAYSFVGIPMYAARYFSFTAPAAALLLGQGWLALRGRRRRVLAAVLAVLLVAPVYAAQRIPTAKHGYDWNVAASYVRAHVPAGAPVYYSPAEGNPSDAYPADFVQVDDFSLQRTAAASGTLFGTRRAIASGADVPDVRVLWVVETNDSLENQATVARERALILQAGFHEDSRRTWTQTSVVRYSRA